jgi:hypothetical protein
MPAGFGLTLVLFSHDILMVISPDEPCLKRLARAFGFLYSYFTVLQILLFLTDLFFLLWKWSILKLLCRNAPLAQDSILPLIPVTFWLLLLCGFWSQSSHVLTEAILTASQGLQGLRSHCMEAPQEAEQLEQLEEAADDESDSRWSV